MAPLAKCNMPGLYFHIPFCRRACTYCDFHFSTSLRTKEPVLSAMRKELAARIGELRAQKGQVEVLIGRLAVRRASLAREVAQ